ncbi:Transposon Tf2-8 polyprotein [Dictyocoela muelleri]|nr:Transposon Tf2-8 polyprotein [Dictyocoela muelleri]
MLLKMVCVFLFQEHGVISYYSKKFNDVERNYSIVEKEMFAIIKTLDFYRYLIQGFPIQIETDNRNCLFANKIISKRIERWKLILNEFDLEYKSITGENNKIADKLSRCFVINTSEETYIYKKIKDFLEYDENTKEKLKDNRNRFIVKSLHIEDFIKIMHEWGVHIGMSSLYNNLKPYYKIEDIKNNIKKVVKKCNLCVRCKSKTNEKIKKYKITSNEKMKILCSDIFGPFDLRFFDNNNNSHKGFLLTITDIYSRYTETYFSTNITGNTLIYKFQVWIEKYSKPNTIICDNGKQYTSKIFQDYLIANDIKNISTPIYHPSSNGISERLNKTIAEILRIYKGFRIKKVVEFINRRLNINYHRTIQEQPHNIIFGFSQYNILKNKEDFKPNL